MTFYEADSILINHSSLDLRIAMNGRILPDEIENSHLDEAKQAQQQGLPVAQEVIYDFFLKLTKTATPETVLMEFEQLFFSGYATDNSEVVNAVYSIILNNNEEDFKNTLKRVCYILVNNWHLVRQDQYIKELIKILSDVKVNSHILSRSLNRLQNWIVNFVKSDDYQELKLYALPHDFKNLGDWSHRYASYLLVPQYLNSENPIEQRELARNLSKRLKEKFKFELAMYTVRCDSSTLKDNKPALKEDKPSNPTIFGDVVIRLIKNIVAKDILFGYENYAHIFTQQTKDLKYRDFKQNLKKYLIFSVKHDQFLNILNTKLSEKIDSLYESYDQEILSVDLLIRTCRRLIDFLTTEDRKEPSLLFVLLLNQESPLTLAITLLKIILICKYVRSHLEICLAQLIRYYENYPEQECQWFVNFLETFNIVFAIYTENVQYNLVKVRDSDNQSIVDLNAYRIFPQLKGIEMRGADLSGTDLRHNNLSDADLRGANLSSADLTQANLSLAKLGKANLSSAMLNSAELSVADLNSADLSGASLKNADLRRANLGQTSLSGASLIAAKLQSANLSHADLNSANLCSADLNASDLSETNLSGTNLSDTNLRRSNLSGANLSGANLSGANLSGANLSGANLSGANLNGANLSGANLSGANLNGANLNRANFKYANLSNANLSYADLSRVDLSNVNLSSANLSYACVRHVNVSGANLKQTNFSGANLFGTNLNHANIKDAVFRENSGLSEGTKFNLESRGAIFENSSGTR
ncbi:MAG: pentapeptide repeat-containing protein [Symploca sp. SIO3C6]|nr:pentapeptide repeat-containing protein [Symploca sp. SIO3C6]